MTNATLVATSRETEGGYTMKEKRKERVEITEGREATTGAFYRGCFYLIAAIGAIILQNLLKENHIGGVLVWIPFYLGVFYLFKKINGMYRVYEDKEQPEQSETDVEG